MSTNQHINPALRYQPRSLPAVSDTLAAICKGDTTVLSRSITLLESEVASHRSWSKDLLQQLLNGAPSPSTFRLGISGTPGVGKSTFIEAYGLELIRQGHRVAVLAVDPSSQISGGSILGDKTRMEMLGRQTAAFIRPSPNSGYLGGVARLSRESIFLCEAAGFDYILVETVGVGQSEITVHSMTDAFLLLAQPGAGDELQGIKRGILEMADLILVNKADTMPNEAEQTKAALERSLHLAPPRESGWLPPVHCIAALQQTPQWQEQIQWVYSTISHYQRLLVNQALFLPKRRQQLQQWLEERVASELLLQIHHSPTTQTQWLAAKEQINQGQTDIPDLAARILSTFFQSKHTHNLK